MLSDLRDYAKLAGSSTDQPVQDLIKKFGS